MNLLRFLPVGICALVLCACATTSPVQVTGTQIVKVEVPVYCKMTDVAKPDLPFDSQAKPDMSLFDKAKLLAAQDDVLKGYVTELEGALAGCKAPVDNSKN